MKEKQPKMRTAADETVMVSFRAPKRLVAELNDIAERDQRTRSNYIVRALTQAIRAVSGGKTREPGEVNAEA